MDLPLLYILIKYALVSVFVIGFVVLFAMALVVRDIDVIKTHPFMFGIETCIVALLPALPILFFVVSREMELGTATAWLYGLSIKFAVFHILFQISGFYTYLFS